MKQICKDQINFEEYYLSQEGSYEPCLNKNPETGDYTFDNTRIMFKLWKQVKTLNQFLDDSVMSL